MVCSTQRSKSCPSVFGHPLCSAISKDAATSRRHGIWDGPSARSRAARHEAAKSSAIGFAAAESSRTLPCSAAALFSTGAESRRSRRPWSNPPLARVVQFVTCQIRRPGVDSLACAGGSQSHVAVTMVKDRFHPARVRRDRLGRRHLCAEAGARGATQYRNQPGSNSCRRAAHAPGHAWPARPHHRLAGPARNGPHERRFLQHRRRNVDHHDQARRYVCDEG